MIATHELSVVGNIFKTYGIYCRIEVNLLSRRGFSNQDKRLAELLVTGKAPKGIAKEMAVAPSKVYYRINRLKKLGVIASKGYTIDFENLGYNIAALIVARTRGPNPTSIINRQGPVDAIMEQKVPGMIVRFVGSSENGTVLFILAYFERIQVIDNFTMQLREILEVESLDKYLISSCFP
jgi:DNA-binding Lrp family transcriptional regulator